MNYKNKDQLTFCYKWQYIQHSDSIQINDSCISIPGLFLTFPLNYCREFHNKHFTYIISTPPSPLSVPPRSLHCSNSRFSNYYYYIFVYSYSYKQLQMDSASPSIKCCKKCWRKGRIVSSYQGLTKREISAQMNSISSLALCKHTLSGSAMENHIRRVLSSSLSARRVEDSYHILFLQVLYILISSR